MKILIAPDKFKGTLTAIEAAAAIRSGFEQGYPPASCREIPIADGGDGTAEVLCAALGGSWVTAFCQDPLGKYVEATYALLPGGSAAFSMSEASGLWRVPVIQRDPLRASTFGTGELIADAIRHGARRILVGLGGSATNDGGMGLAAALGYEFLDADGNILAPVPRNLSRLDRIRFITNRVATQSPEIIALCDVNNPLLGPDGATQIYGPQKGASPADLIILEAGLTRLAEVVARDLGCDFRHAPGAGAAGGLGFGLLSFCGARLCSGFDTIAETVGLAAAIARCDLVVTGEGRLDAQTLAGKGPAGVAALARAAGKPVAAFAGDIPDLNAATVLFDAAISLVDANTSPEIAMRDAKPLLHQRAAVFAATQLARFVPGHKTV